MGEWEGIGITKKIQLVNKQIRNNSNKPWRVGEAVLTSCYNILSKMSNFQQKIMRCAKKQGSTAVPPLSTRSVTGSEPWSGTDDHPPNRVRPVVT